MGSSNSTEQKSTRAEPVKKGAVKAEKVVKSLNGDVKTAAKDVKNGNNKVPVAAIKPVSTAKPATKTNVNSKAAEPKTDKKCHKKDIAIGVGVGVPVVALLAAAGYYLYKNKPWKKNGKTSNKNHFPKHDERKPATAPAKPATAAVAKPASPKPKPAL